MKRVRFGILGCGRMGREFGFSDAILQIWAALESREKVAVEVLACYA